MGADACTTTHTYAHTHARILSMLCVLIFLSFVLSSFLSLWITVASTIHSHLVRRAHDRTAKRKHIDSFSSMHVHIHIALAIRFNSICCAHSQNAYHRRAHMQRTRAAQTNRRRRRRHQICLCSGWYVRGFLQLLLLACLLLLLYSYTIDAARIKHFQNNSCSLHCGIISFL